MRKTCKGVLSLILVIMIVITNVPNVLAKDSEDSKESKESKNSRDCSVNQIENSLVVVTEEVTKGTKINLTQEGSLDWIHIQGNNKINRKKTSSPAIQFENLYQDDIISTANDSPISYSWTDGNLDTSVSKRTSMGVFSYNYGKDSSVNIPIQEEAGYKIMVPQANEATYLTFVSGIWQAKAIISIWVNDSTTPVYTSEIEGGSVADVKKYSIAIRQGNSVTIKTQIKEKFNKIGNLSLGGIALKSVEPSNVNVKVENITTSSNINLTSIGDIDWVHLEGNNDTTNFKNIDERHISYKNLNSLYAITTMNDSKIHYSWSDGNLIDNEIDNTKGAVFNYKSGDKDSVGCPTEDIAGYQINVKQADYPRELTFVSGIWNSNAIISIIEDGYNEPIYQKKESVMGGDSETKKYTVKIEKGKGLTIKVIITQKNNTYGNVNLQAVTLFKNTNLIDYKVALKNKLEKANNLSLDDYDDFYSTQLRNEIDYSEFLLSVNPTLTECSKALLYLSHAYDGCLKSVNHGKYTYESNEGLTASFGWEGDKHAPIAYIDGSYKLRDNGNRTINFGVKDIDSKIKWYNAEGYLPCFVSEYTKNNVSYKIESFSNKHIVNDKDYEIAYSKFTVKNNTNKTISLPKVSSQLIPINDNAKDKSQISSSETVVREYAVCADRFGGTYKYPPDSIIAQLGSFDENYNQMKTYWNNRLEPLAKITKLPDEKLINAYKAGYIYTLIIADGDCLNIGEIGYDNAFDHDIIGIMSTLVQIGDFYKIPNYAEHIFDKFQYPDGRWKYSWPFALYLMKTNDVNYISNQFEKIKANTHAIETERTGPEGTMKLTNAIDSNGYWLIDNWAALTGLTCYRYICDEMYEIKKEKIYQNESNWALQQYKQLLTGTEKLQKEMRKKNNYPYLSINMNIPTENSSRGDVRDANWASMFLFGRWAWDGYLFGADQTDSDMISLIDDTYAHGIERRKNISDSEYNFGGYPHGYYSSSYNAGYGSTALRGEKYRDMGIKAYQFMINNSMSGPFGWWEGIGYQNDSSPWNINHAQGGGGSCQHMWGQATATKVLFDSLIVAKSDGTAIIGRGIPTSWIDNGKEIEVKDFTVEHGKKVDFSISTQNNKVVLNLSGNEQVPVSFELIKFKNNITSVSDNMEFNNNTGVITIPPGINSVTVVLEENI